MLIIDCRESDTIDKALRKYKKKFEKAGILRQLRRRKQFTKPSIQNRQQKLKAIYKEEMYGPNSQE
ncbi:MAG: 30S ribosomal protein S21 [Sphingobacteriales bacterium]|nr:30S ribosomal protein S21 [Sphingobacteriales bacterium]